MARIEYLINNPKEVSTDDLDLLNTEIEKYPYFYSLRALKLLALKNGNDSSYEENLQITAVLSSNRKDLYNYINNITIDKHVITGESIVDNSIQQVIIEEPVSNFQEEIIEDVVIDNTLENRDIISEIESSTEVENQEENIEEDVIEDSFENQDVISEIESSTEVETQEEIIEEEVIEDSFENQDVISEIESITEVETQNEIIEEVVIEDTFENQDVISEIEATTEVENQNEIIEEVEIENTFENQDIISEIESTTEVENQNEIIEEVEIENTFENQDVISEIESITEVETKEEIIEDVVIDNTLENQDVISEIESNNEVETQEEIIEEVVIEDTANFEASIENSLQIAEHFLQKDNEISNAVSETLDINNFVEKDQKIEQISLINRAFTNDIEVNKISKPVSNINSFEVKNTYDVVKGAPVATIKEDIIINEVIEEIIETEEIISEIEASVEIQDEKIEEILTENVIDSENTSSNNIDDFQITEEIQTTKTPPIPTEETIEIVEKSIELSETDKPVEESVSKVDFIQTNDSFSFNDWLKLPSADTMETEKVQKYQIIDEFLEKNPKITPLKKQEIPESKTETKKSNETDFSYLMTETLAQVYIDQKQYEKAIKAYKILSLKYPEKNSLFANQIKEIENLKNSK